MVRSHFSLEAPCNSIDQETSSSFKNILKSFLRSDHDCDFESYDFKGVTILKFLTPFHVLKEKKFLSMAGFQTQATIPKNSRGAR